MTHEKETLITLTLDQLRVFDLNPRISRNPEYDEIKSSIRNRGLEHALQITKRPGESFYIIASGGNTRLEILKELWEETREVRFWEIACVYRKWQEVRSLEEGNLHCLCGHLIENEKRGALTFIERALGVQNAIAILYKIHGKCSQKEMLKHLSCEGYRVSPSVLSIMLATVNLLLPHIPKLLHDGLTFKKIDNLLMIRSGAEKFWERHCQTLPADVERQFPLFDDVFGQAIRPFNEPDAFFSLEHAQGEIAAAVSKTLNVDFDLVKLATDITALKCNERLGFEPAPVLPDISEQRHVDPKYQRKSGGKERQATVTPPCHETSPAETTVAVLSDDNIMVTGNEGIMQSVGVRNGPGDPPDVPSVHQPAGLSSYYPGNDPRFDTPESLAIMIDQTAWELAGFAGLEFLVSQTESGVFDIAVPEQELNNEGKLYWQMLAFLAGRLPGSAAIWRKMLLGSAESPAGLSQEAIALIFQLICNIRRLYEKQRGEEAL